MKKNGHPENGSMRSDIIKKGFERAPHRSLLKATGVIQDDSDFDKPFIAIANSYVDIIPGHAHLRKTELAEDQRVVGHDVEHIGHDRRSHRHRRWTTASPWATSA